MPNSPCSVEYRHLVRYVYASCPNDTSLLLATFLGSAGQHRVAPSSQTPSLVSGSHLVRSKAEPPMVNRFLSFLKEE